MVATSALTFLVIVIVYAITVAQGIIANRLTIGIHPNMFLIGTIGSFFATVALFWFLYRFSPSKRPRGSCASGRRRYRGRLVRNFKDRIRMVCPLHGRNLGCLWHPQRSRVLLPVDVLCQRRFPYRRRSCLGVRESVR